MCNFWVKIVITEIFPKNKKKQNGFEYISLPIEYLLN